MPSHLTTLGELSYQLSSQDAEVKAEILDEIFKDSSQPLHMVFKNPADIKFFLQNISNEDITLVFTSIRDNRFLSQNPIAENYVFNYLAPFYNELSAKQQTAVLIGLGHVFCCKNPEFFDKILLSGNKEQIEAIFAGAKGGGAATLCSLLYDSFERFEKTFYRQDAQTQKFLMGNLMEMARNRGVVFTPRAEDLEYQELYRYFSILPKSLEDYSSFFNRCQQLELKKEVLTKCKMHIALFISKASSSERQDFFANLPPEIAPAIKENCSKCLPVVMYPQVYKAKEIVEQLQQINPIERVASQPASASIQQPGGGSHYSLPKEELDLLELNLCKLFIKTETYRAHLLAANKTSDPQYVLTKKLKAILENKEMDAVNKVKEFYEVLNSPVHESNFYETGVTCLLRDDSGKEYWKGVAAILATVAAFLVFILPGITALIAVHATTGSISRTYGNFFKGAGERFLEEVNEHQSNFKKLNS